MVEAVLEVTVKGVAILVNELPFVGAVSFAEATAGA